MLLYDWCNKTHSPIRVSAFTLMLAVLEHLTVLLVLLFVFI